MNFIKSITKGKRICIFPYTKDSAIFILEAIKSYDNISVFSTPSSLEAGQDISKIINLPPKGIIAKNHLDFKCFDVLIIPYAKQFPKNIICEYIYKALAANLMVIDLGNITDLTIIQQFKDFNVKKNIFYNIDDIEMYYRISNKFINYNDKYKKNDYYIIGIGKEFSDINTADLSEQISVCCKEYGLKPLKISWDYNSYLLDDTVCFSQKIINDINLYSNTILLINNYLNEVYRTFRPDIIILEMYDSLMAINNEYLNNFGIYTYMLSQAIEIDYFFLAATVNTIYTRERINKINELICNKFDFMINGVYLTNNYFDDYHSYNGYRPNFYIDAKLYSETTNCYDNIDNYFSMLNITKLKNYIYRLIDNITEK